MLADGTVTSMVAMVLVGMRAVMLLMVMGGVE